jgi:glycosyltransferase involved in cell wall biosynthesis
MLEAEWVADHASTFDVFHLQFGFDARTPDQLRDLVDVLHGLGKPMVYTVHDLRNPHHASREEHDAQLDVLIPRSDALITLTPGAASEISARWGREATVLPHPHVVDFETMRRVRSRRDALVASSQAREFRVGVHVKSLRASMNPEPVIRALIDTLADIPGAVLQVDGHPDVLDENGIRYDAGLSKLLKQASAANMIDLRIHDFFDDDALWEYLSSLDVSVLPYRFGTHSGWLEACRDLGTAVVAPDCGYYRQQGPVFEYVNNETVFDAISLDRAVCRAYAVGAHPAASVGQRREQRRELAAAHYALYRSLLE